VTEGVEAAAWGYRCLVGTLLGRQCVAPTAHDFALVFGGQRAASGRQAVFLRSN
jgi:hypothetical protein